MSKDKLENAKHKDMWYVVREGQTSKFPWSVKKDGFRDSIHYNKQEAEQVAFELNFLDDNDFWNLSKEDQHTLLDCLDIIEVCID